MGETPATISCPVKTIREAKGLLQWELAVLASTSPNTIIRIECHGHVPKYTTQLQIAKALKVSRQTLWPDHEEEWLSTTEDSPAHYEQDTP